MKSRAINVSVREGLRAHPRLVVRVFSDGLEIRTAQHDRGFERRRPASRKSRQLPIAANPFPPRAQGKPCAVPSHMELCRVGQTFGGRIAQRSSNSLIERFGPNGQPPRPLTL
jgi:hypothetical protein